MPDAQVGTRPRRGRRHRRLLIVVAVLVVLGTLAGLYVATRIDGWLRQEILTRIDEDPRFSATLDAVEIHWFDLRLDWRGFRMEGTDALPGRLEVDLPRGTVRLPWGALAWRSTNRFQLAEIRLDAPRITTDAALFQADPGSETETPWFDLRVDRLRVREGAWRHEDQEIPLELAFGGIDLRGRGGGPGRVTGRLAFGMELLRDPLAEPLQLETSLRFRWRAEQVLIDDVQIRGPGLEARGTAEIQLRPAVTVEGRGELSADAAELEPLLVPRFPSVGGRFAGPVRVHVEPGHYTVQGSLRGEAAHFGTIAAKTVSAQVELEPGSLRLSELRAGAYGGEVTGVVEIDLASPTQLNLDLQATNCDAPGLLGWAGLSLPFSGEVSGEIGLSGQADRMEAWNGTGSFEIQPVSGGPERLPTSGSGTFKIAGGRLAARARGVVVASTLLDVEMDLPIVAEQGEGRLTLEGETLDASDTQRGTLMILRSLGVEVPETLGEPIAGTGEIRSTIRFPDPTVVDLELELADGGWGPQPFDSAALHMRLATEELVIHEVRLTHESRSAHGNLRIGYEPTRLLEADVAIERWDLSQLLPLFDSDQEIDGLLSAHLIARETPEGLEGEGRFLLAEGRWLGERIDRLEGPVEVVGDLFTFPELQLESPALSGRGEARFDQAEGTLALRIDEGRLALEALELVRLAELPVAGAVGLRGPLDLGLEGIHGELELEVESLSVAGLAMAPARGRMTWTPEALLFALEPGATGGWGGEASLGLSGGFPLDATVRLDRVLIDPLPDRRPAVWGELSGQFTVRGPLEQVERLEVAGTVAAAEVTLGSRRLALARESELRLSEGLLALRPIHLEGPVSNLVGSFAADLGEGTIQADARGNLDLALISTLVPELRGSGGLTVDLTAAGPLEAPVLGGTLAVERGRFRHLGLSQVIDDLNVTVSIEETVARFDDLRAVSGGGELVGRGQMALDAAGLTEVDVQLEGKGVRVTEPEGFLGVYDGTLRLTGGTEGLLLSGRLDLIRGLYDQPFDLTALLGFGVREYSADDIGSLPDRVALDLDLEASDGLWARNRVFQIEAGCSVNVGGDLRRPEVTGQMRLLEGGKIRFRDIDYRIRDGSLDFVDPSRLNPFVRLNADTSIDKYDVDLRIEGTLDRIEYELSSTPSLPQEDIIALLATGRTLDQLTGGGSGGGAQFTGDVAANYFAGALTGPFENQLERLLGLERVQINPLLVEGSADPTTRVTLGKEVIDDVMVIFSTDLGSTQRDLYQIEWQARRNLLLMAESDSDDGFGGRLRYTDRYWWKKPLTPVREGTGATEVEQAATESIVELIRFEGISAEDEPVLMKRIGLAQGGPFRRSVQFQGVERIRQHYVRQGQIRAEVETRSEPGSAPGRTRVLYRVDPGPRIDLQIEGVTDKEQRLLRKRLEKLWTESLFVEDLYADSAGEIRHFFEERGYYAVDVNSVERVDEEKQRQVRLVVDKGRPVRVETIRIQGNEGIDTDRIRKQILTRSASLFTRRVFQPGVLEEDLAAVRNLYYDQGYMRVRIEEPRLRLTADGGAVEIDLQFDEGPRFTVSEVLLPELPEIGREQMLNWAGVRPGDPFSRSLPLAAESGLRRGLDGLGYPDARVRTEFDAGEASIAMRFEVELGDRVRVGEVRIQGNQLTRDRVIRRELQLSEGDRISRDRILATQHRLYRLGVFRSVRVRYEPMEGGEPDERRLVIAVEESPPLGLNVGVGYNTEAKANVSFSSTHDNLGGRVRTVGFQGEYSKILERIQLIGKEPRLFGRNLPTLANLSWERRDEVGFGVERRSTAFRADRRLNSKWGSYLRYSFQRVDLFDVSDPAQVQGEKLENVVLGDLGIAFLRSTLDDPLVPTRGNRFGVNLRLFAEPLLSDASFYKLTVADSHHWSLPRETSFVTSVRLGWADPFGPSERVPISERFFAGGDNTIRGFPRDELGPTENGLPVGGEGLLLLNQEFRFPIWRRLRGVVFYDTGNVYRELSDADWSDLRHVLGVGVRFDTPFGPLRLEYGRKLDREVGESSGELFFAIGNPF